MRLKTFSEVYEKAMTGAPLPMCIAAAHDEDVLQAVQAAVKLGFVEPLFVGNRTKMLELAEKLDFPLYQYEVYPANSEAEACSLAADLASKGKAKAIMKGLANSTPFLQAVLKKEVNLRTNRLISHLSAFEIPGFDRIIYMTDGGLNIQPTTLEKQEIIINAIDFLHSIGMDEPRAAILAANERVNPRMPVTVEAQELMDFFQHAHMHIEGPLPLDLAISKESLAHKGLHSKLGGLADLLVTPTIEAGNILGKAITYFAGGIMAGLVLGAKVPLILNSRSDSAHAKLASIAFAALAAANNGK